MPSPSGAAFAMIALGTISITLFALPSILLALLLAKRRAAKKRGSSE